jgi:hypothetical protein
MDSTSSGCCFSRFLPRRIFYLKVEKVEEGKKKMGAKTLITAAYAKRPVRTEGTE